VEDLKGQKLSQAIRDAGGQVDVSQIELPFRQLQAEVAEQAAKFPSQSNMSKLAEVESIIDETFVPGQKLLDPDVAFRLQGDLKDLADFSKAQKAGLQHRLSNKPVAARQIADKAAEAYRNLNKQFEQITGGLSKQLKSEYASLAQIRNSLSPLMKTPEQTYRTLRTLNNPAKKILKSTVKKLDKEIPGLELGKKADLLEATSYMAEPSITPISGGGTTSTTRSLTGMGLGGALGGQMGAAFGAPGMGATLGSIAGATATSPAAVKKYLDLARTVSPMGAPFTPLGRPGVIIPATRAGIEAVRGER